jgi:hypothetical protein
MFGVTLPALHPYPKINMRWKIRSICHAGYTVVPQTSGTHQRHAMDQGHQERARPLMDHPNPHLRPLIIARISQHCSTSDSGSE